MPKAVGDTRYKAIGNTVALQIKDEAKTSTGEEVWRTQRFLSKKERIRLGQCTDNVRPNEWKIGK